MFQCGLVPNSHYPLVNHIIYLCHVKGWVLAEFAYHFSPYPVIHRKSWRLRLLSREWINMDAYVDIRGNSGFLQHHTALERRMPGLCPFHSPSWPLHQLRYIVNSIAALAHPLPKNNIFLKRNAQRIKKEQSIRNNGLGYNLLSFVFLAMPVLIIE